MNIEQKLVSSVIGGLKALYGQDVPAAQVQLQKTKKEFEGHLTLVVFPFLRMSKKGPEQTAQEIGEYLQANEPSVAAFNVIKGFLNLTIASSAWIELLNGIHADKQYGIVAATDNSPLVMIEYSSPNTNKPLHLGHVRNNLLGNALANIVAANGNKVVKTNIVNDRGIHICKSMLAWQKYGNGETPESSGKKGDHLIGDYYVSFDKHYKAEVKELMAKFQSEGTTTESGGRIHTSTATVAVLPEVEDVEIDINPEDVRVDVFRASGNGGQCVNTTDSAVRLTHIPTGEVVSCQDEKSQLKNKEKAMKVLKARLYDKALAEQQKDIAAERKSQVGTGDRSERIRTYNFPQGRVSDHRINLTLYKLDSFIDGDLDEMIDALITVDQTEKMSSI